MEMHCVANDVVIVALFVAPEMYPNDPRATARTILSSFMEQFSNELRDFREDLGELGTLHSCRVDPCTHTTTNDECTAKDPEEARNNFSYLPTFKNFILPVTTVASNEAGFAHVSTHDVVSKPDTTITIRLTSDAPAADNPPHSTARITEDDVPDDPSPLNTPTYYNSHSLRKLSQDLESINITGQSYRSGPPSTASITHSHMHPSNRT
uniref:Putative surface cell antigen sca1 n=1 Tax=Lygus hesperus TaxID=30085 RepID=A0A0A9W9V1_LYGHE